MEDKSIAIAILGIIVVTAIVGLVFLFSTAKTGAGVYTNWDYSKGQVADLFPYAHTTSRYAVQESPSTTTSGQLPAGERYGGPQQFFGTGTEQAVMTTHHTLYQTYKGSAETDVPSAFTTGVNLQFPGDVRAPYCYSDKLYAAKASSSTRKCFTEDKYGRSVSSLLPQYYGCCNS